MVEVTAKTGLVALFDILGYTCEEGGDGPIVRYPAENIIGVLPGTGRLSGCYIVCAHYDAIASHTVEFPHPVTNPPWYWWCENDAPGADDNGTGVATVLETARVLSNAASSISGPISVLASSGSPIRIPSVIVPTPVDLPRYRRREEWPERGRVVVRLRGEFPNIVAIKDADNTFGRMYRKGAVTIGVVVHSDCVISGHGPGVTTIMSHPKGKIVTRHDPRANIARILGIGSHRGSRKGARK